MTMKRFGAVLQSLALLSALGLTNCAAVERRSALKERRADDRGGLTKVVLGYYPSWKQAAFDVAKIRWEDLTHINHAFTKPDAEGNLIVPPDYLYPELVAAAHARGVKVVMSMGGWENCDGFAPTAADPAKRQKFFGQILDFCKTNGYDGVDIDWEFVSNAEERENFTAFVKELSARLKAQSPPLLLTAAVPSDGYWGQWIAYEDLAADFDFISFMTYDYHGEWTDHAGHNSPLYSCEADACGSVDATFNYALSRKIPKEKIVLGIPFYGRSFEAEGLYKKATKYGYYGYGETAALEEMGWRYNWDFCAQVPYLRSPDGYTILCFDDMRSVYRKCRYVLDKGVAGVIVWEITEDSVNGVPHLLNVVGAAFGAR
jgi:chitinase